MRGGLGGGRFEGRDGEGGGEDSGEMAFELYIVGICVWLVVS